MLQSPAFWAWFACVFCVAFTLRCAFAFAQRKPTLFLALCIYASQYAILIVFYSTPTTQNDLLPALSGYLAALAGFLIIRGHPAHHLAPPEHQVAPGEEGVAWLLLLIALPRILASPFGRGVFPTVDEGALEVLVTLVLDTIGYFALYRAVAISQRAKWRSRLLGSPLLVYWALNVTFSCIQLYYRTGLGQQFVMPSGFRYGFAIIKVITVLTFVPAVLAYEFTKYQWSKRVMVFLHLAAGD
jgi:hypothetical protein